MDGLHELVAREQDVEGGVAGVRDGPHRRRMNRQSRLKALEQRRFKARVDAVLAGELTVEVVRGVERLMRVLNVVRADSSEEDHLTRCEHRVAAEGFERASEIAEFLGLAPRQDPVAFEGGHTELFDGRAVFTRQRREGKCAELGGTEIKKVTRVIFPASRAPHVGSTTRTTSSSRKWTKNGASSGGSSSIARSIMKRCTGMPQANVGDGTSAATSDAKRTRAAFRMLVYSHIGSVSYQLSVLDVRAELRADS